MFPGMIRAGCIAGIFSRFARKKKFNITSAVISRVERRWRWQSASSCERIGKNVIRAVPGSRNYRRRTGTRLGVNCEPTVSRDAAFIRQPSPTQDAIVILDSAATRSVRTALLARYRMRRFYRGLGWQWLLMHTWEVLPRVGSDVVDRRQYQINPRLHAFNVQMHSESRYDILYVLRDFRISSRKF